MQIKEKTETKEPGHKPLRTPPDQENKVRETLQDILRAEETGSYGFIHRKLLEKRLGWYERNKDRLNLQGSDVRKAYTLVLFEYMRLDPKEVPVIYEDGRRITWISSNFCPVLEACRRAGADTRKVCKEGWEKSVQVLVQKVNPNLRFSRNYAKLRPYGEYCEETIELVE